MPTYEYMCTECCQEIDIDHSIKEEAREHHPHLDPFRRDCDGKLKQLIPRSTGFSFKGGVPTPKTYV